MTTAEFIQRVYDSNYEMALRELEDPKRAHLCARSYMAGFLRTWNGIVDDAIILATLGPNGVAK